MRIVFMGTPAFAVPTLQQLVSNGYEIIAVYTRQDQPAGRGQQMCYSEVKRAAIDLNLKVIQPDSLRKEAHQTELSNMAPDLIIVVAYGQLLPKTVLSIPRLGCLNIHPSLLPKHRGAAPIASTILNGDKWGGISIMQMDEGLDTGPVLAQSQVLIRDEDTTATLSEKFSVISAKMLIDILPNWARGTITPQPQNNSLSSFTKQFRKEDGEIDWQKPAIDTWRQIRALHPWPGAYTHYKGKVLKVLEAFPSDVASTASVGNVVPINRGCGVVTPDGILQLAKVQYEGKQPMSINDFVNGQRSFIGAKLLS